MKITPISYDFLYFIYIYNIAQLTTYFRKLKLQSEDSITSTSPFEDIQKIIQEFVKQGYLDKQKTFNDSVTTTRSTSTQDDDKAAVGLQEFRWGPRAKVEFTDNDMIEFISAVNNNLIKLLLI